MRGKIRLRRHMTPSPLPHGPGFRLIDSFTLLSQNQISAKKFLDPHLPIFKDHFPDRPIFPAVFLVECAAQAAGILWASRTPSPTIGLAQVVQFKVHRTAIPGMTLEISAELENDFSSLAQFLVQIHVDAQIMAAGRLVLSNKII